MVIFKRKILPNDKIPYGIIIHVQEKGFMDETVMKLRIEMIKAKHPCALFKKPVILVWVQFRVHTTESTKNILRGMNTEIAVIHGKKFLGNCERRQGYNVIYHKLFSIKKYFQTFTLPNPKLRVSSTASMMWYQNISLQLNGLWV